MVSYSILAHSVPFKNYITVNTSHVDRVSVSLSIIAPNYEAFALLSSLILQSVADRYDYSISMWNFLDCNTVAAQIVNGTYFLDVSTLEEVKLYSIKLVYFNLLCSFLSLRWAIINWFCPYISHWFNRVYPQGSCSDPFSVAGFMKGLLRKLIRASIIHMSYTDKSTNLEDNGNHSL